MEERSHPSKQGREKKTVCECYVTGQTACRCGPGMEAEGEVLNGGSILPPCCQISCLRGEDVQIKRRHRHHSSAQPSAVGWPQMAVGNLSVQCFEVFLSNVGLLACLAQPTNAARSRKRVKSVSLVLSLCSVPLSETLSPHSTDCASVAAHPDSLRVELFSYGKLRLIAAQGPGFTQWLPCSGAPGF